MMKMHLFTFTKAQWCLLLLCLLLAKRSCNECHGFSVMSMNAMNAQQKNNNMNMNNKSHVYAVNLKCTVKPERRDEFISLIKDNQQKTLSLEPAALQYVIGEEEEAAAVGEGGESGESTSTSTTNKNTFYFHEEFIGSQGFDAHRDMPHAADWVTFKNSDPFTQDGSPILDFYNLYSETNETDDTESESESESDSDTSTQLHQLRQIPIRPAFCVHVELCIKPEVRQEFIKVILNNQRGSVEDEPLCLQYVFGESTTEENKFIFHEEYTGDNDGKEGFDAHTKALHFQKWEEFVQMDPFTKPPVVNFFKTLRTL